MRSVILAEMSMYGGQSHNDSDMIPSIPYCHIYFFNCLWLYSTIFQLYDDGRHYDTGKPGRALGNPRSSVAC